MYQLTAFVIAWTMEPNWLHIKAHGKAACAPVRLHRRNKGRNKGARNHLPTHVGWFCVGLVFLHQIILKFYSYLGQGRNQTHCSVQHRQRSEKRKEQELTPGIHPFTLWSSKARARREQLWSWWPQNQKVCTERWQRAAAAPNRLHYYCCICLPACPRTSANENRWVTTAALANFQAHGH